MRESKKQKRQRRGLLGRESLEMRGTIARRVYRIGVYDRHAVYTLIGATGPQGGISSNPAHNVAMRIRAALRVVPPLSPCIVYDAQGNATCQINPVTRQREPLPENKV